MVSKPCACGGVIHVAEPTDDEIVREVMRHQKTARHLIWRERGGLDDPLRPRDAYEDQLVDWSSR